MKDLSGKKDAIFAPFLNEYIGIQLRLGFVGNKLATMIMIDPKLQEIFKACKKLLSERLKKDGGYEEICFDWDVGNNDDWVDDDGRINN